jgi:hypothetical protein
MDTTIKLPVINIFLRQQKYTIDHRVILASQHIQVFDINYWIAIISTNLFKWAVERRKSSTASHFIKQLNHFTSD